MRYKRIQLFQMLVTIILTVIYATSMTAQEATEDAKPKHRRWALGIYTGFSSSGPANDLEAAMVAAGFGDTQSVLLGGQGLKEHPFSLTGLNFQSGAPWSVSLHYAFRPPFALGVMYGETKIGSTFGFHAVPKLALNVHYSVNTLASLFAFQVADIVRLGIGPALYSPKTRTTTLDTEDQGQLESKVGFLVDFGLTLPSSSSFFLELRVQYHKVGDVTIGPIRRGSIISRTLPAAQVNYDHWLFSLGFGIGT